MPKSVTPKTDLVTVNHLPGILLAGQAECERWIEDGLIPIAGRRTFKKWGRSLEARLFDPEAVAKLADLVPQWREEDARIAAEIRREAAVKAARTRKERDGPAVQRRLDALGGVARGRREEFAAELQRRTRRAVRARHSPRRDHETGRLGVGLDGYVVEVHEWHEVLPDLKVCVVLDVEFPESEAGAEAVLARPSAKRLEAALAAFSDEIGATCDGMLAACREAVVGWARQIAQQAEALPDGERRAFAAGLRKAGDGGRVFVAIRAGKGPDDAADRVARRLRQIAEKATDDRLHDLRESRIREIAGYDTYAATFPLARSMGRRILFLAGPTNSGKTHEALALAGAAETAEILSPLRLLAIEHFERLRDAGLAAGMVTGEEKRSLEGATHVARTIETLNTDRRVGVCVIDEIQMLGDESRGWAWTQALVGAPAELVVLTGAPEAIPIVERLVALTGEPLEIRMLKRKGELRVEERPLALRNLRRGDAVVAFSRAAVHEKRQQLVQAGFSVAALYGALGPEVRRTEAARFRNGEADILVATDAIGMGLNFDLRRVVFSSIHKFDGKRRRQLTGMEIKQIAGRAGRFGLQDVGHVGALEEAGPPDEVKAAIRDALKGASGRIDGRAYVRPNLATVLAASEILESRSLARILEFLQRNLVSGHPDLRMGDLSEVIVTAAELDRTSLTLADRFAYALAPIDRRQPQMTQELVAWANAHARRNAVGLPTLGRQGALERLEIRAKTATAWLWLAQRYESVYIGRETVTGMLSEINARIEERLEQSSKAKVAGGTGRKGRRKRSRARVERDLRDPDAHAADEWSGRLPR